MRLLRVQMSSHKTVIYHPSLADVWERLRCIVGVHDFETVLEYPSVGAKEEMCIHCMKERYTVQPQTAVPSQAPSAA